MQQGILSEARSVRSEFTRSIFSRLFARHLPAFTIPRLADPRNHFTAGVRQSDSRRADVIVTLRRIVIGGGRFVGGLGRANSDIANGRAQAPSDKQERRELEVSFSRNPSWTAKVPFYGASPSPQRPPHEKEAFLPETTSGSSLCLSSGALRGRKHGGGNSMGKAPKRFTVGGGAARRRGGQSLC